MAKRSEPWTPPAEPAGEPLIKERAPELPGGVHLTGFKEPLMEEKPTAHDGGMWAVDRHVHEWTQISPRKRKCKPCGAVEISE
jgi:hypothetical protein